MKNRSQSVPQTVSLQVHTDLVEELNQFSQFSGFSVRQCTDEAIAHWLQTVAVGYVRQVAQTSHSEISKAVVTGNEWKEAVNERMKVLAWPCKA